MGSRSDVMHVAFVNALSFLSGARSVDGVYLEADTSSTAGVPGCGLNAHTATEDVQVSPGHLLGVDSVEVCLICPGHCAPKCRVVLHSSGALSSKPAPTRQFASAPKSYAAAPGQAPS